MLLKVPGWCFIQFYAPNIVVGPAVVPKPEPITGSRSMLSPSPSSHRPPVAAAAAASSLQKSSKDDNVAAYDFGMNLPPGF